MSNDTLHQVVDTLSATNINLATEVETVLLADLPTEDAALVSWTRSPMASINTCLLYTSPSPRDS